MLKGAVSSSQSVCDFSEDIGFLFKNGKERFQDNFVINKSDLVDLFDQINHWVVKNLETEKVISVLGM